MVNKTPNDVEHDNHSLGSTEGVFEAVIERPIKILKLCKA